tara:strand:+ start:328 stop:708 length:381 start_codon:yes stop_codon:yes gene_type:complete
MNDKDWKEKLSPEQYHVLREAGTELPNSGVYNNHSEAGTYTCAGCGKELFTDKQKFDAGCGWPSFDGEIENANIEKKKDVTHGMIRTEIRCSNCEGHLGHLFDDGPTESGLRYCVNSLSLDFKSKK